MALPNFLIVGAPKAGTTSLYHYLRQHPQVFMSPLKEPRYFAYVGAKPSGTGPGDAQSSSAVVTTHSEYVKLFEGAHGYKASGEASPNYLYSPEAPAEIARMLPDVRLIAILRNPIDRAYSHFMHLRRDGRETVTDLLEACGMEDDRISRGWEWSWHYRRAGLYGEQIRRYLENFPADAMHIVLFEDLKENAQETLAGICRFIGVDDQTDIKRTKAYNVTGVPRSRRLYAALKYLESSHNPVGRSLKAIAPRAFRQVLSKKAHSAVLKRPRLEPGVRRELLSFFERDILELQDLIGRDLSAWLLVD